MFTFPKEVKILQKKVIVYVSPRGYVKVGETILGLTELQKDTVKYNYEWWNKYMQDLFKNAVKQEKKRLKDG